MSRFISWIEAMRRVLKATLAFATVLLVASLPLYRGGVLPEDRRRLLDMLELLAVAFVLSWLIHTIMRFLRRNQRSQRSTIKRPAAGYRLAFWLTAVLAYGWLAALLPRGVVHVGTGAIFFLENSPFRDFGTVSQTTSVAAMHFYTLAAALLLTVRHCAQDPFWRRMIRAAVAVAGTLASVVGMAPHFGLSLSPLWDGRAVPANVFGFFWYHANAASFLALTLPISAWALWASIQQGRPQLGRVLLLVCIALQVWGFLLNYSKVGHVLVVLQIFVLSLFGLVQLQRSESQRQWSWQRSLMIALPVLLLVSLVAWVNGAQVLEKRWDDFAKREYQDEGRSRAAALTWKMAKDAPLGWGPGTFEVVFAHYSADDPSLSRNRWKHAHQDYAQVLAEWGAWEGYSWWLAQLAP
jgi:hypothetical protein